MLGFLLIVGFPVLLGVGFAVLHALARRLGVERQALERHGLFLYLLFLLIPLGVVVSAAGGSAVAICLARPLFFAWSAGLAAPAATFLGLLLGVGLFFGERFLVRRLHAWTLRRPRLHRLLKGQRAHRVAPRSPRVRSLGFLALFAIAIGEEILWRWYLIDYLCEALHFPTGSALLLSGLSFGWLHVHFGPRSVFFKTVAGCVWGGLYLLTASLWAPVVSHFVYNCLVWRRLGRTPEDPST
jgi:membrane protease YdiL (CAAX protease family)